MRLRNWIQLHQISAFALGIVLLCTPNDLTATVKITEKYLQDLARKENPTSDKLQAMTEASRAAQEIQNASYDSVISSSIDYSSSRENPVIQFSPVFDPATRMQVQVDRRLPYGLSVSSALYTEQYSTSDSSIDEATQVGARFGIEVDLWKNWLGRIDNISNRIKILELSQKKRLEEIRQKEFEIEVRKLYWSLVSKKMSRQLSEKLVKSAQKQLSESRKRKAQGAADEGDIARNQSQLYSRQATVLFYDHQLNVLKAQLRKLLPSLNQSAMVIEDIDLNLHRKKVLRCIQKIQAESKAPTKLSAFPELIEIMQELERSEIAEADWLDKSDLKIRGQLQHSNTAKGYSKSLEGFGSESGTGNSIALTWSLPISPSLRSAAKIQQNAIKLQKRSEYQTMKADLLAQHQMVRSSLTVLMKALETLSNAVTALESSLKSTEKKYHQARLDLPTLIFEQDSYFNSKLSEIDTQHQTIQVLMNYFKVYQEYPCEINNI